MKLEDRKYSLHMMDDIDEFIIRVLALDEESEKNRRKFLENLLVLYRQRVYDMRVYHSYIIRFLQLSEGKFTFSKEQFFDAPRLFEGKQVWFEQTENEDSSINIHLRVKEEDEKKNLNSLFGGDVEVKNVE